PGTQRSRRPEGPPTRRCRHTQPSRTASNRHRPWMTPTPTSPEAFRRMATSMRRHFPAGSLATGPDPLALAPDDAGWDRCGLRVVTLRPGVPRVVVTHDSELFVVPLSTVDLTATTRWRGESDIFEIEGRSSVFARV